jgi:hypothetical protein
MKTIQYIDAAKVKLSPLRPKGGDYKMPGTVTLTNEQLLKAIQAAELMAVMGLSQIGQYRENFLAYLTAEQRQAVRDVCARTIAEIDAFVPPPPKSPKRRPAP